MKHIKLLFILILLISPLSKSFCQTADLLDFVPITEEEFRLTEKKAIATINWLEDSNPNEDSEKRQKQIAFITSYLIGSPSVTLELNANTMTFIKKNKDILIYYMNGWGRYALENNYSKDLVKGNVAGIKSVIKMYKKGGFKKDKEIDKLIQLDEKGELENWVKTQLDKK